MLARINARDINNTLVLHTGILQTHIPYNATGSNALHTKFFATQVQGMPMHNVMDIAGDTNTSQNGA